MKFCRFFLLFLVVFNLIHLPSYATNSTRVSGAYNIILSKEDVSDLKKFSSIFSSRQIKSIFIEQWLLTESGDKKLLKSLYALAKKNDSKLYLVTGRNSWLGYRAIDAIIPLYNQYSKYIDGIVFRCEPNRLNIWNKNDESMKVQALNQMLDSYAKIYQHAKKIKKMFIVEFPFWFSDYIGPKGSFSDDACMLADRIIFLIDDSEKLGSLEVKWNDTTCPYYINLGSRATRQTSDKISVLYKKVNEKVIFYSNFQGFILDTSININDLED